MSTSSLHAYSMSTTHPSMCHREVDKTYTNLRFRKCLFKKKKNISQLVVIFASM